MLDQSSPIQDRRVRSTSVIKKLLDSRTGMLARYNELVAKRPFQSDPDVPLLIQEFCQSLVDYTAHAHFQLFRYFAENKERRQEIMKIADRIYPKILNITQHTLNFNDKYDCGDHCTDMAYLNDDLSKLGEILADRIELEDQLIEAFGGRGLLNKG